MDHADAMPDDVFDRLTTLERAQFLYASAQRRHSEALDRQQRDLDRHTDHLRHLDSLVDEQVHLLAQMMDLQSRMDARQEDHAQRLAHLTALHEDNRARIAQNEAMLRELIDLQRRRNGH